ncbi:MAG TPA: hypothetical protein VHE53_03415 [Patescibacteria group bacterium]|nr:hypothetical protein [Patescibacteria group bacterium]
MSKKNLSGVVLASVAAGAVAGAAAVGLSSEENRKKLGKVLEDIKDQAQKTTKKIQNDPDVKDALKRGKRVVKTTAKEVKKEGKPVMKRAKARAQKELN